MAEASLSKQQQHSQLPDVAGTDLYLTADCCKILKLVICGSAVFVLQGRRSYQVTSLWRPLCVRSRTYRKMSEFTFACGNGLFETIYKFNLLAPEFGI
jgi:hypothetical protein